jgi:hypothetical protein
VPALVCLAALSGCVVHEARVAVPAGTPSPTGQFPPIAPIVRFNSTVAHAPELPLMLRGALHPPLRDVEPSLVTQLFPNPPGGDRSAVLRNPLPIEVRISAIRRDDDGTLNRGEGYLATPLPWWQRFPCDAFVDLVPVDVVAEAAIVVPLAPVPRCDESELIESARRDGYAH